jgi:hypothetical protein
LASSLAKAVEPDGNAVTTGFGRFRRRESGLLNNTASLVERLLKSGADAASTRSDCAFLEARGFPATA